MSMFVKYKNRGVFFSFIVIFIFVVVFVLLIDGEFEGLL